MKPQMINAKMNKLDLRSRLVKAAMFAATIFMVAVMTGSIYFKDRVYITDNGVTRELMTSESDVYAILKLGNYQLSSNDKVSYEEVSSNTAYITIYRAFDVNVTADGETKAVPMMRTSLRRQGSLSANTTSFPANSPTVLIRTWTSP